MLNNYAFLSHSKKDAAFARRIYRDLCAKGVRVWMDETALPPGDSSWRKTIATAIRDSACVIVLFSPEANQSEWVQKELDYAEQCQKVIIPVIIHGKESESIPFGYSGAQRIDLRKPTDYNAGIQKLARAVYALHHTDFSSTLSLDLPTRPTILERTIPVRVTATRPSSKRLEELHRLTYSPMRVNRWRWLTRLWKR